MASGFSDLPDAVKIFLVVAVVILTGSALFSQYSEILRTETTGTLTSFTVPAVNSTSTLTGFPFVQTLTGCFESTNASNTLADSGFSVAEGGADGGSFTLLDAGSAFATLDINCSTITYLADTTDQARADQIIVDNRTFVTFFPIIALAVIMGSILFVFLRKL